MIVAILLAVLPFCMAVGLRKRYHIGFWPLLASLSVFSLLIVAGFTIWYYGTLTLESPDISNGDPQVLAGVIKNSLVYLLGSFFYNSLLAWVFYTRHPQHAM